MNIGLLLLLAVPFAIALGMKLLFHRTITWGEFAAQFIVSALLAVLIWQVAKYSQMADTEIINGQVTGKEQVRVSCSHSYECRCRTVTSGSGKNRTSHRECDTCYEHANDWDWRVYSTVGTFEIDRVDRRGSYEPPRWSIVKPSQPVAKSHSYSNYIKAAPDSLFNMAVGASYTGKLPIYPAIYDYQYADRVIAMPGVSVPNLLGWNLALARSLNELGAKKQVNIVVVMTRESPAFAEALRSKWLGGKKNDVVVVIGTDYPTIKWVRVYSWAKHDIINVALRNDLLDLKTLSVDTVVPLISRDVAEFYERRPMADFEYLAEEATPPTWALVLAFIMSVGAAIGLGIAFDRNDLNPSSFTAPWAFKPLSKFKKRNFK